MAWSAACCPSVNSRGLGLTRNPPCVCRVNPITRYFTMHIGGLPPNPLPSYTPPPSPRPTPFACVPFFFTPAVCNNQTGMGGPSATLSDPRLFMCAHGVVGGVLPVGEFAGGHAHFVSQFARRSGVEPFSVHTTFQYGGAPGKRHRLREAMLW